MFANSPIELRYLYIIFDDGNKTRQSAPVLHGRLQTADQNPVEAQQVAGQLPPT